MAWVPANFDHTNITGNCFSCHNGTDATGKHPTHINTTDICEDCHNNVTFSTGRPRVDHTQVLGTCFSCHDGATATGKHPTHLVSGNNCDDCHTTSGWVPANFDHTNITNNCISCHNGTDATGKPPTHINRRPTSASDCHNNVTVGTGRPASITRRSSAPAAPATTARPPRASTRRTSVSGNVCDDCHTTSAWVPGQLRSREHRRQLQRAAITAPMRRASSATHINTTDYLRGLPQQRDLGAGRPASITRRSSAPAAPATTAYHRHGQAPDAHPCQRR